MSLMIMNKYTMQPNGLTKVKHISRVSSETSFASKQLKLEPKLVLALYETKCLFWFFQLFTETVSFGVSIKPKQKKNNRNKP